MPEVCVLRVEDEQKYTAIKGQAVTHLTKFFKFVLHNAVTTGVVLLL